MSNLKELKLAYLGLPDAIIDAIVASPHMSNLQILNLDESSLTDEGIRKLANSEKMSHLTTLSLNGNDSITNRGIAYIANSKFLTKLESINLAYTMVNDAGVMVLIDRLKNLKFLYLEDTRISDKVGIRARLPGVNFGFEY